MESKLFESLHIDVKKGEFLLNGEDMKGVSHLELEFNNGEWSLLVTRDEFYKAGRTNGGGGVRNVDKQEEVERFGIKSC